MKLLRPAAFSSGGGRVARRVMWERCGAPDGRRHSSAHWLLAWLYPVLWAAALNGAAFHNVRDYGAAGDGAHKDTAAVQSAIDAAAREGGGTVAVPAGRYLCGTIHLKSDVTLYLAPGAALLESPDNSDFDPYEKLPYVSPEDRETTYFHYALLAGENVENVAIVGQGTIDGNRPRRGGPKPIALKLCRHVTIRGITIRRAPNYCISLLGTDYVLIDGVTMVDNYADGIDPDSCRYVRIANCYFDGWDDAIVAKASFALGYRRSTENLTVTNCILSTNSCYLKFGSESAGDFKNVAFTNTACYRRPLDRPASEPRNLAAVGIDSNDGSHVDGVTIENIVAQDVYKPFFVKIGNRGRGGAPPGTVRNISIRNFVATGASVAANIDGMPDHPIQGLTLDNVTIGVKRPAETAAELARFPGSMFRPQAAYALVARYVEGLTMSNVRVRWEQEDQRPAVLLADVRGLTLNGFRAAGVAGGGPVVALENVSGALIQGCRSVPGTAVFLRIGGAASRGVRLTGNDFSYAAQAFDLAGGAPASAVTETGDIGNARGSSAAGGN